MTLTYKSKQLQNMCEAPCFSKELVKRYGVDVAKKLPQKIQELKSFEVLSDVPTNPPFRRHKLTGNRNGCFAIDITKQYRLIFKVTNDDTIIIEELNKIKEIMIVEISKHYE